MSFIRVIMIGVVFLCVGLLISTLKHNVVDELVVDKMTNGELHSFMGASTLRRLQKGDQVGLACRECNMPPQFLKELFLAMSRGVQVRLLLAGDDDHRFSWRGQRFEEMAEQLPGATRHVAENGFAQSYYFVAFTTSEEHSVDNWGICYWVDDDEVAHVTRRPSRVRFHLTNFNLVWATSVR